MVLGITGGVATGKSTVGRLLRDRGATLLSADDAARAVTAPGTAVLQQIADAFGSAVLKPDGSLDRSALGEIVFNGSHSSEARLRLEAITHPAILDLLREQIAQARRDLGKADGHPPRTARDIIAVEVPLLYEAGIEDWFDRVVVVSAPEVIQIARLRERSGLTEPDALGRIRSQLSLAAKRARADFVIENSGSPSDLAAGVDGLIEALTRRPSDGPAVQSQ